MEKITKLIKEKGLTAKDCEYHTIRTLENDAKIRGLVIKGENIIHIELICPNCGHYEYKTEEYTKASKGSMYRFKTQCSKCKSKINVPKLKGGPKKKKKVK